MSGWVLGVRGGPQLAALEDAGGAPGARDGDLPGGPANAMSVRICSELIAT